MGHVSSWARHAGRALIAVATLALVIVTAWLHPVGDYYGETDFYGGYVEGAALFQSGHPDPTRYGVIGPVYDALLALVGWITRDFFIAGKWIAVASAVAAWTLWRGIVAARLGDVTALWATAFFVTNPVFFQSGYSVSSHATAVALQIASLAALLRATGRAGLIGSGALAGAAALVRYPGVLLLPAAWLILWFLERPSGVSRRRSTALHLAGFLLVALPWTVFSLSRGFVPAQGLYQRADFYFAHTAPSPQDEPGAFYEVRGDENQSLVGVVRAGPAGVLRRVIVGAGTHLVRDARELLGIPVAALALIGIVLAHRDATWRSLLPLGVPWLLHFLALAAVYYNSLYALALLPFFVTLAGVSVTSRGWIFSARGLPIKPVLALFPLAFAIHSTVTSTRFVQLHLPVEVREAGRALARLAAPGEPVIARKGHVGYYSGLPVTPFPRVRTVEELAAYCRSHEVGWIYYSWYEALLRPEFLYLLDTTAVVPGLTLVHSTRQRPCRVFRVEAGFGTRPAWWGDVTRRGVHIARGAVQVLEEARAWEHHLLLAYDAASREDARSMLEHADAALRGRPGEAHAWALRGAALQAQGRAFEAIDAYRTALRLEPGIRLAEEGLRRLRAARHSAAPAPARSSPAERRTRFSARRRRRRCGRCSPPRRTRRAT